MYSGNSELITFCQEVYQLNQDLSKSVSTSSGFVENCINFIRSELVHGKCTSVGSFDVTFNQDTCMYVR